MRVLVNATDLPVNADSETGFADNLEAVAANVRLAINTGIAGLSIEDRKGGELCVLPLAVERIQASREAINNSAPGVLLVGRSEGFLVGRTGLDAAIARLVAYAEAGADVLYAPGVSEPAAIKAIVEAVAPKPVNVLLVNPTMQAAELGQLGVRRISVGGFLAHAAWTGFTEVARRFIETGSPTQSSFPS